MIKDNDDMIKDMDDMIKDMDDMIKDNEDMINNMANDMEANHILSTVLLDTLPDDVGAIEVNLLDGEAYYEHLANDGESLVYKISFFKTSGQWYTTEYFSIKDLGFAANEIGEVGYAKASQLYQAICDHAKIGYDGMIAVLDFPAFYPSLFLAEDRG